MPAGTGAPNGRGLARYWGRNESVSVSFPSWDWTVYFSFTLIVPLQPAEEQVRPAELFVTVGVPVLSVITVNTLVPAQTVIEVAFGP